MARHLFASLPTLALTLILTAPGALSAAAKTSPGATAPPPAATSLPAAAKPDPKDNASRLVSLDAKSLPLRDILSRIREQTGYAVIIDEGRLNTPITLHLSKVDVEAAVRRLARKLSLTNYALVMDSAAKTILLRPADGKKPQPGTPDALPPDEGALAKQPAADIDPLDVEIIPPEPGQKRGITQREMEAARAASEQNVDPLDVEVLPPGPGQERGMTQRELDAARAASEQNIDPLDVEVIPPGPGQERGITQREIEAARTASEQNIDPLDVEVVPPGPGQERGMTLRELNAARDASAQSSDAP
jgi:hypothetical protein